MPPIIQPRRLPTVRLVHRKDPKNVRVVDQRVYAIAPERWRDFKIETFLNQQADPDVVEAAVREWEINEKRLAERDAKKDWEFTSKQTEHNVVTEPVVADISVTVARKADVEGKPATSLIAAEIDRTWSSDLSGALDAVAEMRADSEAMAAELGINTTTDATVKVRPGPSRDMTPKRRGRPPKVKG